MRRTEKIEMTNMVMICDGDKILVQNRVDPGWSGIVFPGGHVEAKESIVASAIREIREETGLTISNLKLVGIKQLLLTDERDRYLVFLFRTDTFSGEIRSSEEGEIFWATREELKNYRFASGFERTFELYENPDMTEIVEGENEEGEWVIRLIGD